MVFVFVLLLLFFNQAEQERRKVKFLFLTTDSLGSFLKILLNPQISLDYSVHTKHDPGRIPPGEGENKRMGRSLKENKIQITVKRNFFFTVITII